MRIVKKIVFNLTLVSLPFMALSQQNENLVNNGSFEKIDGKVKRLGSIETAFGWVSPTGVRADLFAPSKDESCDVPLNEMGKEKAKDGENYAGIIAFSYGDKMSRSYIMTKLDRPLIAGEKYCVQFNVSLAECSKYSSNQVGINFSKVAFGTDLKTSFIDKTHVVHEDNKIFNAFYNWEKICDVFVADGGEKYLTIGNFSQNDDTMSERNKKPSDVKVDQIVASYYYIDDVSVQLINEYADCTCAKERKEETAYPSIIYQKNIRIHDQMTANEKIEAQQVYFSFGRNNLSPAGTEGLDLIAELLNENPQLKLEVLGHSNDQEISLGKSKETLADMDGKRISEVIEYIRSKGVSELRMTASPQQNKFPNPEIYETDNTDLKAAKNCYVTFKVR
jgi:hypothetical protein